MSLAGILTFGAVMLAAAALRDLGGDPREAGANHRLGMNRQGWRSGPIRADRLAGWMAELPLLGRGATRARLARAGARAVGVEGLAMTRLAAVAVSAALSAIASLLVPGRLMPLVLACGIVLGLAAPDLLLERAGRRRRDQVLAVLPDTIDILAVAAAGGRGTRAALTDLARGGDGPLARELAQVVVEIESGDTVNEALRGLRRRLAGPEMATLTLAIERSARLGSPLADELHRQAASLRDSRRRRVAERAARAAPKIQLVIALVLVPSVLLLIAAGLAANADRFFSAL